MSTVSAALGAVGCVVVGLLAAPYLARLTLSVPDGDDERWWTGRPASRSRLGLTTVTAVVLGGLAGAAAGLTALLPAFLVLALLAAPLVVIDLDLHRLPNRLVLPLAGLAAVLLTVAAAVRGDWHAWLRAVEGAVAVFVVLWVLNRISPRSFGRGDVKLGGILGGYLGWFGWTYVYYGIFAGFLLGSVLAVVLLAGRRGTLKTAIAFGPMMFLGALLVLAFDLAPTFG